MHSALNAHEHLLFPKKTIISLKENSFLPLFSCRLPTKVERSFIVTLYRRPYVQYIRYFEKKKKEEEKKGGFFYFAVPRLTP